jgi:polyphenol oxidase
MRRVLADNAVVFYASDTITAIGVRHGFSTRLGGVSGGAVESLNFGLDHDTAENVESNFARLLSAVGVSGPRYAVRQVHGSDIADVACDAAGCDADAIICDRADRAVVIRTADCAAVLLASGDGGTIAAVHAGWRGVVAEVISAAAAAMRKRGAPATHAAVFPCISAANYEVGPEVWSEFAARGLPHERALGTDRGRVDVAGACAAQLRAAGVGEVEVSGICTFGARDEFFSHRRDHGITGRMALVASPAVRRRA